MAPPSSIGRSQSLPSLSSSQDSASQPSTVDEETALPPAEAALLEELLQAANKSKCVFFGQGCRSLFSFLDNDFPSPMEFGGRHYTCATSTYEAQKFHGRPDLMHLFTTLDARQAFALSAEKHMEKTLGWYDKRVETMYHVLRAKFGENPQLSRMLRSTADAYLSLHALHKNMDSFWTDDSDGAGQNKMGQLLMQIRREHGGPREAFPSPNYRELALSYLPSRIIPPSLSKSDAEIRAEIDELNRQIDDEANKSHTQHARNPENGHFTRFKFNNFPFDKTLVPLSSRRFINANFVFEREYIGTQSPMPHTNEDFWSMVLEHKAAVVIMLNRLGDPGDEIYFPLAMNDPRKYGNIHLALMEEPHFKSDPTWRHNPHEEEPHAVIHRKIKIWLDGVEEFCIVDHFQYLGWRDFSAGNERAAADLAKAAHAKRKNASPVVVHCHAGVGRTSVMIAILEQYKQYLSKGIIDIKRNVERQRSQLEGRCNTMMQSTDQYHFCYRVLRILCEPEPEVDQGSSGK